MWASQSDDDGNYGYRIGGAGTVYRADLADPGRISRSLRPLGGIAAQSGSDILLANPDEDGALLSDLFDTYDLDEAEVALTLIFADGTETESDRIALAQGIISEPRLAVRHVALPWRDFSERVFRRLPTGRIVDPKLYPFAPKENWGCILPTVLGDLRGQAFDVTTPASGVFPHVPAPATNAQRQRFFVSDVSASADREALVELYSHLIQIPDASRTLGSDYLQVDTNEFWLWLRPHRIDSATSGVSNPEYACTHDLDQYATVYGGTALIVGFPGANANLGRMGVGSSLVAADVTVYVVYTKIVPSDANPGVLTIRLAGVGIPGHMGIGLNGSGTAVEAQQIGDHLAGWDDLHDLSVIISTTPGTSGVYVRRILLKVVFRCDEVRAAFEQQRVLRSQQGFIESATAPTEDYQDGNYLWSTRTSTPFRNPADIAEVLLRHRQWGLGLRAPSLTSTGATLAAVTYADPTSWTVSDGGAFSVGDELLADREVVVVTQIAGNTLTVMRGAAGSMATSHASGTVLYRFGAGGDVDSASFRGASGVRWEPDRVELLTNGGLEGTYVDGVAPSWSEYDLNDNGTPSSASGYVGRYAQQITRTSAVGSHPGIIQYSVGVTAGAWYRLRVFARCTVGTTYIQLSIGQAESLHPSFAVDMQWRQFSVDFKADTTSVSIRLRNAGGDGAVVQFDGASVQKLVPWQMDFALIEAVEGKAWFDRVFLPQAGMRLLHAADGRIRASAHWPGRPSATTLTSAHIVVDRDGAPKLSLVRTPLDEVVTGVTLRYAYNRLTGGYDGLTSLSAGRSATGQSVSSVASGSPLDTLTVASSSALAPKDAADETSSNITASGTTVTLPSGDLANSGVAPGDWLLVHVSYGTFLFQIASVLSATQLVLTEQPPQFADLGQWSAGNNLYLAGNEIFGTCLTPTGTTVTIFRKLDDINLTTHETMEAGDVIWSLASASNDGTGARDEGNYLRSSRERRAMLRLARYKVVRTLPFDAPYLRDWQTAVFLRNHLFDAHDRAWLVTLTTDLSTLALDVGDHVTIEHDLLPGGTLSGEIIRQSVDVNAGEIEYVVRT